MVKKRIVIFQKLGQKKSIKMQNKNKTEKLSRKIIFVLFIVKNKNKYQLFNPLPFMNKFLIIPLYFFII